MTFDEEHLLSDLQKRATARITKARGGVVWWKVGEGKTRIALSVFARLQAVYNWALPNICLVVCRRKAFTDWTEEIQRCFPGIHVYVDSCPAHPLSSEPVFLLVSEGMLAKEVATLQRNGAIRFVILDELYLYANHKSARAKAARMLALQTKVVGLSGTVMKAGDTFEIYAQLMCLRKEKVVSKSPTQFRSDFQICVAHGTFSSFSPKKGSLLKIMTLVDDVADVNFPKKSERKIHEQFHNIPATSQQRRYFRELKDFMSLEDFGMEFNSALAPILKAQQIANGWVNVTEKGIFDLPSNKLEKCKDELSDIIAAGDRAVVWCAFRHDIERLADYLPFATVQMLGGQEFDLDRWRHPDTRVCLATEASGSSVNHFDQTPYAIYFSANYKWLDMQQSRGRTNRKSSSHTDCFYKYLQVEGSMDKHIYQSALASGQREAEVILHAGLKKWFKS